MSNPSPSPEILPSRANTRKALRGKEGTNGRQGCIINEEEKRNVESRRSLENWLLSIISRQQVDSEVTVRG